jgi:Phage P22-like portal protein
MTGYQNQAVTQSEPSREMPRDDAGDEDEILSRAERFYRDAMSAQSNWRKEAREDFSFVAGKQWSDEDKSKLAQALRPVITFNRVQPVIDSVGGAEVQNRQEVRYIPRKIGDAGVNEVLSNAAKWMRDECDAEDEESDAFLDTVIAGMGWTETRLCYESDPEGKVFIERVDPLEMVWDPRATKRNLTDARMVMRIRIMAREDVEALWPDKADELTSDVGPWTGEFGNQEDDNEIHDATDAPWYRNNQSDGDSHTDELVVVHFQWFERETAWRVADPSTGEIKTLDDKKYQRVSSRMVKLGMKLKAVKQTKKVYKQAFICGKTILASGNALCPDHFTFRAITGKRDHNAQTWYGLVRAMKDPQRWANKWLSQGMHIFNSNAKGGLIAERGAFENPEKAEDEWADPTSITFLNPGGLGKIQPKEPVQFPQGITDLLTFGVSSIRDVTGVNLEMLGLAEQDQAGVVEWHRKKSALTVLANFFDSLRRYRKEQGRVMLYIIQHYLSDGRLVRIEGPEATQYIPLMHDPNISTYDVVVDDAPSSPNQKEMVWGVLQQMLPSLLQLGMPVPPDVLDYSPLPTGLAQKWKQMILQQQQQPNPQQALAQSQLAIAQAQVESAKARAQGDQAKAQAGMAQAQATGQQAQADMAHAQVSAAHVGIEQQATQADIEAKRAAAMMNVAKAKATLASIPTEQLEAIIRSLDTLHGVSVAEREHHLDTAQAQHDAAMDRHGAAMDQRQQQHAEQAHADQDAVAQRQADIAEQAAKARPTPK